MSKGGTLATQSGAARDLARLVFCILGPPGSGKTWGSLTLSKKWPKDIAKRTRKSKLIVLDDIIHIGWDPAALVGLISHNVEVKYSYDMQDILSQYEKKGGFPAAIRALSNDARTLIYNNDNILGVIHDTITAMDTQSLAYYEHPVRAPRDRNNEINTMGIFGLHLGTHRAYYTEMIQVPDGISTVFLFHERVIEDVAIVQKNAAKPGGKKQALLHQNKQLGNMEVSIIPAGTGQGIGIYNQATSLEMAMLVNRQKGKDPVRKLYPIVTQGRRAKNRFEHQLKGGLEPNLRSLVERIRTGE